MMPLTNLLETGLYCDESEPNIFTLYCIIIILFNNKIAIFMCYCGSFVSCQICGHNEQSQMSSCAEDKLF